MLAIGDRVRKIRSGKGAGESGEVIEIDSVGKLKVRTDSGITLSFQSPDAFEAAPDAAVAAAAGSGKKAGKKEGKKAGKKEGGDGEHERRPPQKGGKGGGAAGGTVG